MSEISETIIFNRTIIASDTDTLTKKIPFNCYIIKTEYFFAKNQQNLLHVDVRVKGVSVAKYEADSNKYVMGDGVPVTVHSFFEVSPEEKLECWYENTDSDDTKTLFVIVHLLRKLRDDEKPPRIPWWM